jgi:hypothetical protein
LNGTHRIFGQVTLIFRARASLGVSPGAQTPRVNIQISQWFTSEKIWPSVRSSAR